MSKQSSRQPTTWQSYEHGRASSPSSVGSASSRNDVVRVSPSATSGSRNIGRPRQGEGVDNLRERRSSISMRIASIRHAGGANSIDNFARSWQRAAGFHDITPVRRSSVVVDDAEEAESTETGDEEYARPHRSLLRQLFESAGGHGAAGAVMEEEPADDPGRREGSRAVDGRLSSDPSNEIFSHTTHLATPLTRSFGTSYGSLSSRINESSRRHAARLFQEQLLTGAEEPDKEREPLLVKQVENEDGTLTNVIVGQSTLPQTVFNSVNTLIGVGLLSLPLGIKYAGWVVGLLFLFFSALTTSYTAKLLATCLEIDQSLITYADLAYVTFGSRARIATGLLFSFELIAACVALIVLFADSLDALIPGWGVVEWKIVCGILMIPLNFAPLRLLSFSSVLGIICCTTLVAVVIIDGIVKPHCPGSLREPATTYLFPQKWSTLPLSFGLLMSPWGGHSVFPSIYRDMRHPQKYEKSLRYTYSFTFGLDLTMAVVGLLMFGNYTRDEVTSNILLTKGYPRFLSIILVVLIAVIPLTKIPLSSRPIISTVEVLCGLDPRLLSPNSRLQGLSALTRGIFKILIRLSVVLLMVVAAMLFPNFDSIMALMGSALCFTICIILPVAFYLRIFGTDIPLKERILNWVLIISCSGMAVVGTVWAFLPKEKIGAKEFVIVDMSRRVT